MRHEVNSILSNCTHIQDYQLYDIPIYSPVLAVGVVIYKNEPFYMRIKTSFDRDEKVMWCSVVFQPLAMADCSEEVDIKLCDLLGYMESVYKKDINESCNRD